MSINNNLQQGVTLIELMIALALGLLLSAAAIMMFVSNKETSMLQENFARLQENGRFAMNLIIQDIRNAGYSGCKAANIFNALDENLSNNPEDFMGPAIYGYNAQDADPATWKSSSLVDGSEVTVSLATLTSGSVAPSKGTDVFFVRVPGACGGEIYKHPGTPGDPGSADIKVSVSGDTSCIQKCMVAMVSDCTSAAIFQITNYTASNGNIVHNTPAESGEKCQPGNKTKRLGQSYEGGSLVIPANYRYFISDSSSGSGARSLYRASYAYQNDDTAPTVWGALELVEGVQDMQLVFMQDENNNYVVDDDEDFKQAEDVTDWEEVIAVKFYLVAETPSDLVLDASQNYPVNDLITGAATTVTMSDRRLRKVFTNTVVVRNKVL